MSLQVEKLEKNMAKFTIEVPADDLRESASECIYEAEKQNLSAGIP